jgi:hypothetical protein
MHSLGQQSYKTSLLKMILASTLSIVIAYVFGDGGFDAFLGVHLFIGLTFWYYLSMLVYQIFASKNWLIFKLLSVPLALFFGAGVSMAIIGPAIQPNINPKVIIPDTNWVVVIAIIIAHGTAFYTNNVSKLTRTIDELFKQVVTLTLSILVLSVGFITFAAGQSSLQSIVLIFTVEAQFIASYIYIKTNFLDITLNAVNNRFANPLVNNSQFHVLALVGIMSLPFTISLLIMLFIAAQ